MYIFLPLEVLIWPFAPRLCGVRGGIDKVCGCIYGVDKLLARPPTAIVGRILGDQFADLERYGYKVL